MTPSATSTLKIPNAAYFGMFAIDPGIHGGGLGKLMIAEAERSVQSLWGANQMVMTVINLRTELIDWYKRRGYRLKGGEPDLEKAAITLLTDYRSGALGRISLETPDTRQAMLANAQRAAAEKAARAADEAED